MKKREKLKKAIAIAVAYYIEQEKASLLSDHHADEAHSGWFHAGRAIQMNMKQMIQQRGSIARPRTLFSNEDPNV